MTNSNRKQHDRTEKKNNYLVKEKSLANAINDAPHASSG